MQHKNDVGQSMRLLHLRYQVRSTAETPHVKHKYPYQEHYWIWLLNLHYQQRNSERDVQSFTLCSENEFNHSMSWPFTDPGSLKLAFDVLHAWVTALCLQIKFCHHLFYGRNFYQDYHGITCDRIFCKLHYCHVTWILAQCYWYEHKSWMVYQGLSQVFQHFQF